jgi:hypothetical protein
MELGPLIDARIHEEIVPCTASPLQGWSIHIAWYVATLHVSGSLWSSHLRFRVGLEICWGSIHCRHHYNEGVDYARSAVCLEICWGSAVCHHCRNIFCRVPWIRHSECALTSTRQSVSLGFLKILCRVPPVWHSVKNTLPSVIFWHSAKYIFLFCQPNFLWYVVTLCRPTWTIMAQL